MEKYPDKIEEYMLTHFEVLNEKDRRHYAAIEALKLGHGGIRYISLLFNMSPKTVKRGMDELKKKLLPINRVRSIGGGRKNILKKEQQILSDFLQITNAHKAGCPMNFGATWTYLSQRELSKKLKIQGHQASRYIVNQCFEYFKFGKRKLQKKATIKTVKNRDDQFQQINRLRASYAKNGFPVISLDSKKKELLGSLYREGKVYTLEELQVFDHDFQSLSSGKVVPHGIYDLIKKKAYINLCLSKDTAEFCKFCIKWWWSNHGKNDYPDAKHLLILCDGGGSNSSRHHLFKEAMYELSNELNIEIRIAHYPPYCSKYNPIEHKVFPHILKKGIN